MLPASRSADRTPLHPLRAARVSRLPARGLGRIAVRRMRKGRGADRPPTGQPAHASREHARDEDHHRHQRRRVRHHRRARRRELQRHRSHRRRSRPLRPARTPRRVVADVHGLARARGLPPHLLQHAPAVDRRAAARAGRRTVAVRAPLRRVGARRFGRGAARRSRTWRPRARRAACSASPPPRRS